MGNCMREREKSRRSANSDCNPRTAALAKLAGYAAGMPSALAVPLWLGLKVVNAANAIPFLTSASFWGRIPDIIATIPGSVPPTTQVLDAKFPGDDWRDNQKSDYKRINKGKEPVKIDGKACGCP